MSTSERMRKAGLTSLVGLGVLCSALASPSASASDMAATALTAADPRPLVLMIHADWCGTCRVLGPVWEQIQTDFAGTSTIVTLDVTDRPAYTQSVEAAEALGIAEFFARHRAKTGTIAVLACESREPIAVLSGERDFAVYQAALAKAACETS